jgi:hypothetical protein
MVERAGIRARPSYLGFLPLVPCYVTGGCGSEG